MRPVFGFSPGMFSIFISKRAESASTVITCVFRLSVGSAQTSMVVRSAPMPASDRAAATLRLAGKPRAASRAVPSKTLSGSAMVSMAIACCAR